MMLLSVLFSVSVLAQEASGGKPSTYILGVDDQVLIKAVDVDEFPQAPVRIDLRGFINLPMVGRLKAGGLTIEGLEAELIARLKKFVHDPQVIVTVAEFRSQPVSVLGAVMTPGVQQIQGHKTLFEVLSLAGGLRPEAGNIIKVTRKREHGAIPLPGSISDSTGQFYVGEVNARSVTEAKNPAENIQVMPNDVISVPKADLVYVIGEVQRAGGFVLNESGAITVLQALSLAGGLGRFPQKKAAKILRLEGAGPERKEIALDVQKILNGKSPDVPMRPEDILFIPNSQARAALGRGAEAVLGIGTNIAIYRGGISR